MIEMYDNVREGIGTEMLFLEVLNDFANEKWRTT